MKRLILPVAAMLALAACESETAETDTVEVPIEAEAPSSNREGAESLGDSAQIESGEATPMSERVATIGLLNKRNNLSEDLAMSPGESREIGPVIVRLSACERTAPWEMPQETGAFVQVDIRERGNSSHTRVFSGWLFKESPSLNVVEHPVYDVWVKDCAMSFPGEE